MLKLIRYRHFRGFTLVELLIVIAIIGILAGVIFVNYQSARQQARDERRMSDIAQIKLVMRLYKEAYPNRIDCDGGVKIDGSITPVILSPWTCPDGAQILSFIAQHMKVVPHDPMGPGSNDYFYYFDAAHECMNVGVSDTPMVYAANLESYPSNASSVCSFVNGNDGGYLNTRSYTGIYRGTKNPSKPYVMIFSSL